MPATALIQFSKQNTAGNVVKTDTAFPFPLTALTTEELYDAFPNHTAPIYTIPSTGEYAFQMVGRLDCTALVGSRADTRAYLLINDVVVASTPIASVTGTAQTAIPTFATTVKLSLKATDTVKVQFGVTAIGTSVAFATSPGTGNLSTLTITPFVTQTAGWAVGLENNETPISLCVKNSDDTGVLSWQLDCVWTPVGASQAITIDLAHSDDTTSSPALAQFVLVDIPGSYRFVHKVWGVTSRVGNPLDTDMRNILCKEVNGLFCPPTQIWPKPLPPLASGLPGAKPNETNLGGREGFGWAGTGSDGLLDNAIKTVGTAGPPGPPGPSGALPVFQTLATLTTFDATGLTNGLLASVVTPDDIYELVTIPSSSLIAATDGVNIVQPTTPNTARWVRHGLGAAYVANWYVNASTGNDTNDGTITHPLASVEELSHRLCPGGAKCIIQQSTNVFIAAGSYGKLTLDISWPNIAESSNDFVIWGTISQAVTGNVTAVVNTAVPTTRGQITVASGTLVAHQRLSSPPNFLAPGGGWSTSVAGQVAYSTGLNANAQNSFVSTWLDASGHAVNLAPGGQVSVDTLLTTISSLSISNNGVGRSAVVSCILPQVTRAESSFIDSDYYLYFVGCEISGNWYGVQANFEYNRITAATVFDNSKPIFYGLAVQSPVSFERGSFIDFRQGNVVDGGNIVLALDTTAELGVLEIENGSSGLTAIEVAPTCALYLLSNIWGLSTPYGIGIELEAGSNATMYGLVSSLQNIPATVQIVADGHRFPYSAIPFNLPNSGTSFALDNTPGFYNIDPYTLMFSEAVAKVPNWYVNASTGSDANDGHTSGTAFATTEKLSQTLCPLGTTLTIHQSTAVHIAAGSYGAIELSISAPVGSNLGFDIFCAFTSSSPIPLATVVNTVESATPTRGEITTVSGTFAAGNRIRSTSGANVGAITYVTALNGGSTDAYVKTWFLDSGATVNVVNIASGTTVVVDTLGVTIARVQIRLPGHPNGGPSGDNFVLRDAILPNGAEFLNTVAGSDSNYITGCLVGGVNVSRFAGSTQLRNCRIIGAGTTAFLGSIESVIMGCLVDGASLIAGIPIQMFIGNCFANGGNALSGGAAGGGSEFAGSIDFAACEWTNGSGTAVSVAPDCYIKVSGQQYGFGTSYAVGFALSGGANAVTDTEAHLAIPATQQIVMAGNNVNYSQVPISYPNSNCSFVLLSDTSSLVYGQIPLGGLLQDGATLGQALIWDGTSWQPGDNFSPQNLVTTGALSLGATPARVGSLRLGNAATVVFRNVANTGDVPTLFVGGGSVILNSEVANNGVQLWGGGAPVFSVGNSGTQVVMALVSATGAQSIMQFADASSAGNCTLQIHATSSATGRALSIVAQGAITTGGALYLASGLGLTQGRVAIQMGGFVNGQVSGVGYQMIELANLNTTASPAGVLSLCFNGVLSTTQMPTNTGDGVIYLREAGTIPSANPSGGTILYVDPADHKAKIREQSGLVTILDLAGAPYAAGTLGQALIWNGTTYAPGDNFAAQNLVTTGSLSLGTNPSATGTLRLGNASTINFRNAANTGDFTGVAINGTGGIQLRGETIVGGFALGGGASDIITCNISGTIGNLVFNEVVANQRTVIGALGTSNLRSMSFWIGATGNSTGAPLFLNGQNANVTGGDVGVVSGNSGTTGPQGRVYLQMGGLSTGIVSGTPARLVELANLNTSASPAAVLALCYNASLSTTQMPPNTGNGVIYIAEAGTIPSANPSGGTILYVDPADHKAKIREQSGLVTVLDAAGGTGPAGPPGPAGGVSGIRTVPTGSPNYTLQLSDANGIILCTWSPDTVIQIPLNSAVNFPVPARIEIVQTDDDHPVLIQPLSTVTLITSAGITTSASTVGLAGTNSKLVIEQIVTDVWRIVDNDAEHVNPLRSMCCGYGFDGDLTVTNTIVTLTSDMYYRNLTMGVNGYIKPNGYRIFVQGTLDISNAEPEAFFVVANAGANASGSVGGGGGAGSSDGTIAGSLVGYDGPNAFGGFPALGGEPGTSIVAIKVCQGGPSGPGGDGGAGDNVGGSGGIGTTTDLTVSYHRWACDFFGAIRVAPSNASGYGFLTAGAPGSSGGTGGNDTGNTSTAGAAGGGGAGGGFGYISCYRVVTGTARTSAIFQAKGGAGGVGGFAPNGQLSTFVGGGGGGSGGGGGWWFFSYFVKSGATITGAFDVTGGAAGAGGNGLISQSGGGGSAGGGGRVILVDMGSNLAMELGPGTYNAGGPAGASAGAGGVPTNWVRDL